MSRLSDKLKLIGNKKMGLSNLIILILVLIIILMVAFSVLYRKPIAPFGAISATRMGTSVPPVFRFTLTGDEQGFNKPLGVTGDGTGTIYVADSGNGVIKVFDGDGKFLRSFGQSELRFPFQITFAEGLVWVADPALKKVQVFEADGKFVKTFVSASANKPLIPTAVAVVDSGEVYVADTSSQTIRVYDGEGKELRRIGHAGNDKDGLLYPNALWVTRNQIFVSDTNNARIQVYDLDGRFVKTIGTRETPGALTLPRGITVTNNGEVIVVDVFMQAVRAYNSGGSEIWTLGKIGQNGNGNGEFNFPNGIWLDQGYRLYVTDRENNRVQVFEF